jgi:NAD-dependent dihydropyrimidine dehydrogenase PreA subunit
MPQLSKARPFLEPEYCKGCGRCIDACALGCIEASQAMHTRTGLVPVALELEACTGCALCIEACPEPYALRPEAASGRPSCRAASWSTTAR